MSAQTYGEGWSPADREEVARMGHENGGWMNNDQRSATTPTDRELIAEALLPWLQKYRDLIGSGPAQELAATLKERLASAPADALTAAPGLRADLDKAGQTISELTAHLKEASFQLDCFAGDRDDLRRQRDELAEALAALRPYALSRMEDISEVAESPESLERDRFLARKAAAIMENADAALRKAGRLAPVTAEFVNPQLDALLEDLERDPRLRPGG